VPRRISAIETVSEMCGTREASETRMTTYPQQNQKPESRPTSFYVQSNFCAEINALRRQFDNSITGSLQTNQSPIALTYAFRQDGYQFLTASSERLLATDTVEHLMDQLRAWADATVGSSHVSTPQARVFISGCRRDFARDNVTAQWHYILSLTPTDKKRLLSVELVSRQVLSADDGQSSIDEVVSLTLEFNQLLIHCASDAYAIKPTKTSMNPLDGGVFLDGYLW